MFRPTLAVFCLASSACAFEMTLDAMDTGMEMDDVQYRIDVYPPPTSVDLAAQSFYLGGQDDLLDVTLSETVNVQGVATGWQVTPWAGADVPGTPGGVEANVRFKLKGTIQSPFAQSDTDGAFALRVVPDVGYQVSVEPIDPSFPLYVGSVDIDPFFPEVDLEIGYGVPVYGQITDTQGFPVGGAEVYVVHETGIRGPSTVADGVGNYVLRVQPGERYYVASEGRSGGRDPLVHSDPVEVADDGAEVDVLFPVLNFTSSGGRVVDPEGQALDSATIRFIALELDEAPEQGSVELEVDVRPTNGNFDVRLLPGRYRVEILPDPLVDLAPVVLDDVIVGETLLDIGTIVTPELIAVSGTVTDLDGEVVPNTIITWREIGLGERSWSVTSNDVGQFEALVPAVGLNFTLQPPALRDDLGLTRLSGTPTGDIPLALAFEPSSPVSGTVSYLGEFALTSEPLGGAVVEIRSAAGELLAITLSDATGRFSAQLTSEP